MLASSQLNNLVFLSKHWLLVRSFACVCKHPLYNLRAWVGRPPCFHFSKHSFQHLSMTPTQWAFNACSYFKLFSFFIRNAFFFFLKHKGSLACFALQVKALLDVNTNYTRNKIEKAGRKRRETERPILTLTLAWAIVSFNVKQFTFCCRRALRWQKEPFVQKEATFEILLAKVLLSLKNKLQNVQTQFHDLRRKAQEGKSQQL